VNVMFLVVLALAWAYAFFLFGIMALLLWQIASGRINLGDLITQLGQNVSHFQMLMFTFMFATIFFIVVIGALPSPRLPDIPQTWIYVMAASYGVYFLDVGLKAVTRRERTTHTNGEASELKKKVASTSDSD